MKVTGNRVIRTTLVGTCAAASAAVPIGILLAFNINGWALGILSGAALGGILSGFFSAFDQLWTQRSGSLIGRVVPALIVGCFGGGLAAFTGQALFSSWGHRLVKSASSGVLIPLSFGTAIGWALTGLVVGLAITLPSSDTRDRWAWTVLGGVAGGFTGGFAMQAFQPLMGTGSLILGLCTLGTVMGLGISWAEKVFSKVSVQVLEGSGRGSIHNLGGSTFIGSDKRCKIYLTDAGIAPRHARISARRGRLLLEDLGSVAGCLLNDRKISGTQAPLSHGDLIRVGKNLFRINAPRVAAAVSAILLIAFLFTPADLLADTSISGDLTDNSPRITQIDSTDYPLVDMYVTLPTILRPDRVRKMRVYEGKQEAVLLEVRDLTVADRDEAMTVSLVLDTSLSMEGTKLGEAKQALQTFSQTLPSLARINLITFSDSVRTAATRIAPEDITDYTRNITASGHTALFDAIVRGTDLVAENSGRRVVLVLTDGMANRGSYSMESALAYAEQRAVSLLIVGLGTDVRRSRLTTMAQRTGGKAVFTTAPEELSFLFGEMGHTLSREVLIRYKSTGRQTSVVPVQLTLGSSNMTSTINGRYMPPTASIFGNAGSFSWVLILFGLIGPAGLFTASRLTSFVLSKDPIMLVEGSSNATRLLTKALRDEGMTVPMNIGGKTVMVNNQPVSGTRTLRTGDTLTWGETTILFTKK